MANKEKKAVKIKVPSEDPKKEKDLEPKLPEQPLKDDNTGAPEESEEDKLLRERLEAAVRKLTSDKLDIKIFSAALETLSSEIQKSTSSMTSVPKPLKFLRPFYNDIKTCAETHQAKFPAEFKREFYDVLSVLAMTMAEEGKREMLRFKLLGNRGTLGVWGHEFVRALCGEISQEYASVTAGESQIASKDDLIELAHNIVPFLIEQNTETEAVDLLFELEDLEFLLSSKFIDKTNYERTCLYLTKFSEYIFELKEFHAVLYVTYQLYLQCEDCPNALRIALMLNDEKRIAAVFDASGKVADPFMVRKQLGFILGSHRTFQFSEGSEFEEKYLDEGSRNEKLSHHFRLLAENLGMSEAKSPEDVYKSHLLDDTDFDREKHAQSASKNMSSTYVNAFVNCGFEHDSLLNKATPVGVVANPASEWVFKNKDHGIVAAVASIGMTNLWGIDVAANELDKWLSFDGEEKTNCAAGAILGLGVSSCGLVDQSSIFYALVSGVLEAEDDRAKSKTVKICAALGYGLAHASQPSAEAYEFLSGMLNDDSNEVSVRSMAALAIGFMHVGTGNADAAGEILTAVWSFDDTEFDNSILRFLALGVGLIYLGRQDEISDQIQAVQGVENSSFSKLGSVIIEACAYAGSGNVIQVQKMLQLCAQHVNEEGLSQEEVNKKKAEEEEEKARIKAEAAAVAGVNEEKRAEDEANEQSTQEEKKKELTPEEKEAATQKAVHQSIAVLGVALITFGDSVGRQMAERTFQHLLQYGDLAIRRAVPLAMALSHVSDPDYGLIDILSKLTHDSDLPTAQCAIMALGLMAAGTTNSRVAQLLRQLAVFYKNDKDCLFVVRLAQGLLFTGKGLVSLNPFHSDRTLLTPSAVASLLTVLLACFDLKNTLFGDFHILMFTLATAIHPRMCMTFVRPEGNAPESELEHVKVKVRVGQAVETVGQAGNPKKITGFQTQETPVLINVGDRVELASDEFEPYSGIMEGIVLLKRVEPKGDS